MEYKRPYYRIIGDTTQGFVEGFDGKSWEYQKKKGYYRTKGERYKVLEPNQILQIDLQPPMKVFEISQDGKDLKYNRDGNAYLIELKKEQKANTINEITVHYGGNPRILDYSNGNEIMDLLTELNEDGTTIVMVTHSEHDAKYSHRIIRMLDGKKVTESVLV